MQRRQQQHSLPFADEPFFLLVHSADLLPLGLSVFCAVCLLSVLCFCVCVCVCVWMCRSQSRAGTTIPKRLTGGCALFIGQSRPSPLLAMAISPPRPIRCGKNALLSHYTLKRFVLPRQARDKHRKSLRQKRPRLLQEMVFTTFAIVLGTLFNAWLIGSVTKSLDRRSAMEDEVSKASFVAPFYSKQPNDCQDRLGTSIGKALKKRAFSRSI